MAKAKKLKKVEDKETKEDTCGCNETVDCGCADESDECYCEDEEDED